MRETSKKITRLRYTSAVVVAAGSSSRMGFDKMFADICGFPVIALSIAAFNSNESIDEIIIVTREQSMEKMAELCKNYSFGKVKKIVMGGADRVSSSLAGISETNPRADVICIHDGARPLVSADIIRKTINAAYSHRAAAPAVKLKDTVKEISGDFAVSTPDRETMRCIQTPQAFEASIIKAALSKAVSDKWEITDDCSAVERLGVKPYITEGHNKNIKITTPEDIEIAELFYKSLSVEVNIK